MFSLCCSRFDVTAGRAQGTAAAVGLSESADDGGIDQPGRRAHHTILTHTSTTIQPS